MQNLLIQQQNEQLMNLCTFFGARNKVKEQMMYGSMPALVNHAPSDGRKSSRHLLNRGIKNDVILKNDEAIGRCHFRIRFDPIKNKFLMKDMGDGSGTFIRIEEPTVL
jgi:hypothetical protein